MPSAKNKFDRRESTGTRIMRTQMEQTTETQRTTQHYLRLKKFPTTPYRRALSVTVSRAHTHTCVLIYNKKNKIFICAYIAQLTSFVNGGVRAHSSTLSSISAQLVRVSKFPYGINFQTCCLWLEKYLVRMCVCVCLCRMEKRVLVGREIANICAARSDNQDLSIAFVERVVELASNE